ncbi:hypothetical protein ACFXDH_53275, partial [Streptomyces sp. NPDC059467]
MLRLAYLTITNAFAALRLLPMSDRDKPAMITRRRHDLMNGQRARLEPSVPEAHQSGRQPVCARSSLGETVARLWAQPMQNRRMDDYQNPQSLRSPRLRPGDRVRIVAPACPPSREEAARGVDLLTSWGLQVELGEHVFD